MPPKAKATREEILKTALELIREGGEDSLNARALAGRLGVSTQPIFSNFENMDALGEAVRRAVWDIYLRFRQEDTERGKYPPYKASGMSYIRFAREEPQLFRMLFMCQRSHAAQREGAEEEILALASSASGATGEATERFHFEMWAFVHGIAVMTATGYLTLEEDAVSDMLTEVFRGLKAKLNAN